MTQYFQLVLAALLASTLAGCELIGSIFEAGVWVGVILVVAVLALLGFVIAKMFK